MFNFSTLLTIIEGLVSIEPTVMAEITSLLANPAVVQLEGVFASLFHLSTTSTATGSAAVVTPTVAK